jgi:hypothetical protein
MDLKNLQAVVAAQKVIQAQVLPLDPPLASLTVWRRRPLLSRKDVCGIFPMD